jgi:methyltransferase (TIGR00027 family)
MPRGASITAEAVCLHRAIETRRPDGLRLMSDPFAEAFLSRASRAWLDTPLATLLPPRWWPLRQAGFSALQTFIAARHRYIDDALLDFLGRGGEQVVILGAGYDARALRFADALSGRTLIEVDFPATQREKRLRLDKLGGAPATYVPIDFETQTLAEVLGPHVADRQTFFIWEGVAMYLHAETVDRTLATLAALAAPRSEVVCDLWGAARGRGLSAAVRRASASFLGLIGEPLRFTIHFEETAAFFGRHGYELSDGLDSDGLVARYGLGERAIFPDNSVIRAVLR